MGFEGHEAFDIEQKKADEVEKSRSDRKKKGVFSFDPPQHQYSNTTPPIQASISPDIACGKYTPQTPACFAMGHLISGMPNRRCRAKGILKVSGCEQETADALAVPPLTKASMEWIRSPSQNQNSVQLSGSSFGCGGLSATDTPDETTPNWLVSSPGDAGGQYLLDGEGAPRSGAASSPGLLVWRTPSTDSSCSPFTSILKRAADWSDCSKGLRRTEENGRHCYGEFASASNVMSNAARSPSRFGCGDEGEEIQILPSFSPQSHALLNVPRSSSLLPEVSFQVWCPSQSSQSNYVTNVRKSLFSPTLERNEQHGKELASPDSEVRVSWRDGLTSRILDMDETDCCFGFSNVEGDSICFPGANENLFNQEQKNSTIDVLEEPQLDGQGVDENIPSVEHTFFGENPGKQADGLVYSSDSDWSVFFKNQLFQH